MSLAREEGRRPLGEGWQTGPAGLVDEGLGSELARYKRAVAGRYRALTGDEIGTIPAGDLLVSPKLDGEQWFLIAEGGEVVLANPAGRVIGGALPLLDEARAALAALPGRTVLAGELLAVREGGRSRSRDLARALSGEAEAEVRRLAFQAFDVVSHGGTDPITSHADALERLRAWLEGGRRVQAVRTVEVSDHDGLRARWVEWVESDRAEGLVVRGHGATWKVKPTLTFDAAVVGFIARGEDPTQVKSILLAMAREDGTLQVIGRCGNFPGDATRREVMTALAPLVVDSAYREVDSDGVVFQFVRPERVVEVRVTDVQAERSDGSPVLRMVLGWEDGAWRPLRRMPSVSVLHPVFLRDRDDKRVDVHDVRIAQLLDRVDVPQVDAHAEAEALPPSEKVRREVWVKPGKGGLAVRKLLIWRTHKETSELGYPAYVVHWTDYSPGRKDPLQRTLRLAPSEELAQAIGDDLVSENIKRGWNPA